MTNLIKNLKKKPNWWKSFPCWLSLRPSSAVAADGVKNGVQAHRASFFSLQECPRRTCLERNRRSARTQKGKDSTKKTKTRARAPPKCGYSVEVIGDYIPCGCCRCPTDKELLWRTFIRQVVSWRHSNLHSRRRAWGGVSQTHLFSGMTIFGVSLSLLTCFILSAPQQIQMSFIVCLNYRNQIDLDEKISIGHPCASFSTHSASFSRYKAASYSVGCGL